MKTKNQKLYGLLVGINAYKDFPLNGCLNDVKNINDYLEKKSGLDTDILKLTDKNATKTAIVSAFRTHLSKATKDDTIVFYFSGHGTKEKADPIWEKDSTTAGLECMVCYNGTTNFLLADKEVRFLLHELWTKTHAHIVVITDCCHSADNTRGELIKESFKKKSKVNERRIRLAEAFEQREWKQFIFSDSIKFENAKAAEKVDDFLKEGNHIHLAACELDESALEVDGNGVFTTNLLKILENSAGNVSYHSLQNRIRNYMQAIYEQKPRIFSKGDTGIQNLIFLNKGFEENKQASEIIYAGNQGWKLNIGAVHGVKTDANVEVFDNLNNTLLQGKVKKVFVDYSLVSCDENLLNEKSVYKATVEGAITHKLNIRLNNFDTNQEDLKKILDSLNKNAGGSYEFTTESKPEYTLHFKNGRAYLTKFNDDYRPLFYPLNIYSVKFDEILVRYLKAVSKWKFVEGLKNENSTGLLKNPLEMEFVNAISGNKINIENGKVKLDFEGDGTAKIKLKIKNVSSQKVYVCVAYLDAEFGINLNLLPSGSKSQLIEPNKETFLELDNEREIDFHLGDATAEYNNEFSIEKFNFITSTTPFDTTALAQDALPAPPVLADADRRGEVKRSLGKKIDKKIKLDDWTTQNLTIEFGNPFFNKADKAKLQQMLAFEDMAEFVVGNYYDIVPDAQLQPNFRIKLSFNVPESERSFFQDMVMETANRVENVIRRVAYNAVKNNPNRMRIVAEGDSWFLYPFILKEIIDQLSPLYAIRSVAEAGDTLQNYINTNEYKRAIEQENPKLFLVSGGGNDILGEELEDYIKENSAVGRPVEEYLTPKFEEALVKLDTLYRQMFSSISTPTIVHGYDYIFPVDRNVSDAQSWAGEFMFNKKIKNPADQRRIIVYLIDKFNDLLKKLDADFAHVHYLDVRNSVPNKSDWHDEIHPKSVGYNSIAIKFTHKINELIESGEISL